MKKGLQSKNILTIIVVLAAVVAVILFQAVNGGGEDDYIGADNVTGKADAAYSNAGYSDGSSSAVEPSEPQQYSFRSDSLLKQHYEKHGSEFGYSDAQEYVDGANAVINSPYAMHKKEKDDNDDIYYLRDTNEYVVVSTDGYLRTYFKPDDGISYYNRK